MDDTSRCQQEEREIDESDDRSDHRGDADPGPPAVPSPLECDEDRYENERVDLGGDREPCEHRREHRPARKRSDNGGKHERGGDEVEAGQEQRAEQERCSGDEGKAEHAHVVTVRAENAKGPCRENEQSEAGHYHLDGERLGVAAVRIGKERRHREHSQSEGRVLGPEVAVRDFASLDGVAVALVDRDVGDRDAVVPDVGQRCAEQDEGDE